MSPKKLIALSAFVVALFVFILVFERRMPTTEESARKGDLYWDIPQDRIHKLELSRGGETLEFQRAADSGWRMVRPEKFPADGFAVGSVLTDLAELKRAGGEDSADAKAADYGLDKPVAKATLSWSDGEDSKSVKSRAIEFGAAIPGTEVVAARVEGTQKVLFVPASVLTGVRKNADDFESREVFGAGGSDAVRLEILRGRGKLAFGRKEGAWWLAEPVADLADGAAVDRLVGALAALRVKDFLHGSQDLASLGLNPPLFHVALTGARGAVTAVDFGATRADGNTIYARRDQQVLTVDRDVADELSKEAEAFRSRGVLGFSRGDVVGIEAVFPKARYTLTQKDGGWTADGRPVLAATADDVIGALLDLKSRDFLDDAEVKALDPPTATVSARTKSGIVWNLALRPHGGETAAQAAPRPGGFVLEAGAADRLEAAFAKAMAATAPVPSAPATPAARKAEGARP